MNARRKRLKVGVLFGGQSAEHEVSVVSAQGVMAAIDPARYQSIPIGVTRQGTWLTPAQTEQALDRIRSERIKSLDEPLGDGILYRTAALSALRRVDVVFPLIHGTNVPSVSRFAVFPAKTARCRGRYFHRTPVCDCRQKSRSSLHDCCSSTFRDGVRPYDAETRCQTTDRGSYSISPGL